MDDVNTTPPVSDESPEMSFSDKLMNVFSAPGELFEYVAKSGKQTSNWSVPLILTMIVSVIFCTRRILSSTDSRPDARPNGKVDSKKSD